MNKITFDVDLDFANRDEILSLIEHVPASMSKNGYYIKHNSGVYVTDIPTDYLNNFASIDYQTAEELGYFKLDFLNMGVYTNIQTPQHLDKLLNDPIPWQKLQHREFVQQVVHISNHFDSMTKMPEPVNSIPRLAMFLSVIRPGKKHLIGKKWQEVAETVWDADDEKGFVFKKSHSISYATLCAVHMRWLVEQEK